MSETKSDSSKPARSSSTRARSKAKTDEARPAPDDDGFAAGIVDEAPPTPVPAEPAPARVEGGRVDPNEHGFDAETNSRYEEIKRGNTYITELQHMTIAQLQKTAKDEN